MWTQVFGEKWKNWMPKRGAGLNHAESSLHSKYVESKNVMQSVKAATIWAVIYASEANSFPIF